MIAFSVSDLSLSFGDRTVLNRLSFAVNEGDKVGVIGVNGAGKTSLFRLITGEYAPTSGDVYIARDKVVGHLAQNTDLSRYGNMTLFEYLLGAFDHLTKMEEEISRVEALLTEGGEAAAEAASLLARLHENYAREGGLEYRSRCRSMLARMGFPAEMQDSSVSTLSGGQHTRLSLARLLARAPDILLLDEPTNHLDIDALTWLEDYLAAYTGTLCVISHDRYFLDRTTTKTLQIRFGGGKLYMGGYSRARAQQEADEESQERQYKEQQREIAKIRANIDFQRRCGQAHNFVTIRSKEKQLAHMDLVERVPRPDKNIRLRFALEEESAGNVVEARGVSFSYSTAPLIKDLSFLIRRGECVLFLGANGCGKSTLMKLIRGELKPTRGVLDLGYNIKIGYYDQENRSLNDANTVFEEIREAYPAMTNTELRSALALFLFGADDIDKRVGMLSGGERARLTLAKLVLSKVNLLVLDEPTNHLDIGSREALENALAAFGGTIIAVSHDRYFISRLASRIIELNDAAEGGYYDYPLESYDDAYEAYMTLRERRRETEIAAAVRAPASTTKQLFEEKRQAERDRRNAEKRRERTEKKVTELETELATLDEELFGSAATDYVRAAEIEARKTEIEEELLSLYELIM